MDQDQEQGQDQAPPPASPAPPFPEAPLAPPAPQIADPDVAMPEPFAAAPPPPPPGSPWQTPMEPAGPAPGFRFAGHGGRLIAYIIDIIIVSIAVTALAVVIAIPLGLFAANDDEGMAVVLGIVLTVVVIGVSIGYFPYFWMRSGQTPGMKMFRLRVVRDRDGGPISGGQALLRLFGLWLSGAVFYLGYIWILIDSRRRGWHDLIAGTVVIESE